VSGGADHQEPVMNISTWTIERLEAYAATQQRGQEPERIREVGQAHAHRSKEPKHVRLRWAKVSLDANARLHGNSSSPWERARMARQNFALRTWIIEHLGPDADPDWDPDTLAADTLAALTLDPSQASAAAANWPDLPLKQADELRRHKYLTSHLPTLITHLQPGPARDQLASWIQVREHLP
jgi:hypothetical protein